MVHMRAAHWLTVWLKNVEGYIIQRKPGWVNGTKGSSVTPRPRVGPIVHQGHLVADWLLRAAIAASG